MPPKRIRRGRCQPKTPKWVPTSPEEAEEQPKDENNNVPTILEKTVFPPGTPGILIGIITHPVPSTKAKHITGFVLRRRPGSCCYIPSP
ncbi:hypothetical protein PUN28_009765 [Cardiocondyla obscurior]|uniref:Uncharacterized protein n=1 Tax=Cardiocondyla obscurior TaxID=286306 RepID=A0AAW2FPS2_9HYME